MATLSILRQKLCKHLLVQKNKSTESQFLSYSEKSQRTTFLIPKYFQEIKFGIKHYRQKHCKFSMFVRDEVYMLQ